MNPDCEFLSFTNGTLIDEEFCQEMLRVKNFVPAISLEGTEATTDGRRGDGVYQKVMHAMELLKSHGLPFGVSTCYTSANVDAVSSEEYFDHLIECGAYFAWFFHYMTVGNDAAADLLPTPEQRIKMYDSVRRFRATKSLFTMDFQNDAEYVGGCIAGGRRYLHINAKTCFVHVRCLKILSFSARWLSVQERNLQIFSLRKQRSISVQNVITMQRYGRNRPMNSGVRARQKKLQKNQQLVN